MPRTLYLHIGKTKTGSTSIQNVLHKNRKALAQQGVYYPETHFGTLHMLIALMFSSYPNAHDDATLGMWQGKDPWQALTTYRTEFIAEMTALPPEITKVIISSEPLSQLVKSPDDIAGLHALLAPFFDEIRVIVYLRRQDAHNASLYSQAVRMGRVRKANLSGLKPYYADYDYEDLIGRWAAAFGEAAMMPRIFERLPGKPFDVIQDFTDICGFALPAEGQEDDKQSNPSMNRYGQQVLVDIRKLMRTQKSEDLGGALWKRVSRAVTEALPGQGWQPSRSEATTYMERFAATNERVRAKWFPERETLFSMDFSKLPEAQPLLAPADMYEAACKVILTVASRSVNLEHNRLSRRKVSADKTAPPAKQRAALLKLIKVNPQDVRARMALARLQIAEGALEAARTHLNVALRQKPDLRPATVMLRRIERQIEGQASPKAGDKPQGGKKALKAVTPAPSSAL